MKLKHTLILAIALTIISTISWEAYWRSQGHLPNIDDNKNLWANQRKKLEAPKDNAVVIIGSSRILYDIQMDVWTDLTKTYPIMLATQGASPIPVFKDIVENTDFKGTLMVGVTPSLLFATLFPEAESMKRSQSLVDYYYNRTYAQSLNHKLSIPLQKNFAFIRDGDEAWDSDVDLKTLLKQIHLEPRTASTVYPPFNNFEDINLDRHMKMPKRMETDTLYANTVKKVWTALLTGDSHPPPEREATINTFSELSKKFIDKSGQLILVRCPSSGLFKDAESKGFPKEVFWDKLVQKSGGIGYNYFDFEQFQNLFLPEWSHLATSDAQFFTKELIKIMKSDGIIFK